jgi:hypothetical protein
MSTGIFEVKQMKDSLLTIWESLKPYVLGLTAITPILLIVYNFLGGPIESFNTKIISLLFVELAVIIAVVFEVQKKIDGFGEAIQFEPSSISNNSIWLELKGKRIPSMDICALNGGRIAKCLYDHDISVDTLRAIFPSDEALKLYFSNLDHEKARVRMNSLSVGAAEFEQVTSVLKTKGRIGDIKVIKVPYFTDRLTIIPGEKCALLGIYYPDNARSASTGLRVETRLEKRSDLVRREIDQFRRIWAPI